MTQSEDLEPGIAAAEQARADEIHRLARAGVTVVGLGLVWKVLGLVREAAVGALFGANRVMDAFVVAKSVPDMFSTWIEAPLRAAIVPLFTRRLHEQCEASAWGVASNVLNTLAVVLVVLTALLFGGADLVVRLFSSGFREGARWDQSADLARILVVSIIFSVIAVVLGSLSNVYGRQFVPAMGRNANALVVLAGILVLGPWLGITGYAWGILLGSVVYFVLQLDVVWRHRRHYRPVLRPFAPEIREIVGIAFPLFIGLTGTRIDVLLDRNFASYLAEGSLSVLTYATLLSAIVTDLVMTVTTAVLLPHFSRLSVEGRSEDLRRVLAQSVRGYLFVMAPVSLALVLGARPIVDAVYARGEFGPEAAALTALVLMILAPADPVFGAGQILAQAHIGRGDTRTPMYIGFWRIGFKALCSVALLPLFGILGLAAASASSSLVRTFLLWRRLPDELRPRAREFGRELRSLVLPAVLAAAVMGAGLLGARGIEGWTGRVLALGALAAGGLTYLGLAVLRGDPMIQRIREQLRRHVR